MHKMVDFDVIRFKRERIVLSAIKYRGINSDYNNATSMWQNECTVAIS